MIDEPNTAPEGSNAPQNEPKTPNLAGAAAGAAPAPDSEKKEQNPKTERAYRKYIVRPVVTSARWLGRCVRLLHEYDGAITAVATIVIGLLTWKYVTYSKAQWEAMQSQRDVMQKQLTQMELQLTEMKRSTKAAEDGAKAAQDGAELNKRIVVGTDAAIIEDLPRYEPQPNGPPVFSLNIRNEGKSISPHVTGILTVSRNTLPALKTIEPRPFTIDMVQLANDGGPNRFNNGKSQTFQVPGFNLDAVLKLQETVKIEGTYHYDDGFGRMVPKYACYQLVAILNSQACAYQGAQFMTCGEAPYQASSFAYTARNCKPPVR